MNRSKCVVCGKVRYTKYLISYPNLEGHSSWLCSRPTSYGYDYLEFDDRFYSYSPCVLSYLKSQYDFISNLILKHQLSKNNFYLYDIIKSTQLRNVSPELTFLLQF